jgi:hypothetical protein
MSVLRVLTLVGIAMLLISVMATALEKKIKRSDLPPAVEKTVAAESKGATIRGFAKETENGQINYEVELMVDGHSKDIALDATGAIVEVEEQVAINSLPATVKDGLQAKAGRGTLLKVESIVKHDKLVAYEAKVVMDGTRSEVRVGPDGKSLDHEE